MAKHKRYVNDLLANEYNLSYSSPGGLRAKYIASHLRPIRREVFQRDGFKCRNCGAAAFLEMHHIVPRPPLRDAGKEQVNRAWAETLRAAPDVKLALDPKNCITLCRVCHHALVRKDQHREDVRCLSCASTGRVNQVVAHNGSCLQCGAFAGWIDVRHILSFGYSCLNAEVE